MKVFALICAAAIAISTPTVQAATTEKACTNVVCAESSAVEIPAGDTVQISPPSCPNSGKAYVTAIKYDGQPADDTVDPVVVADAIKVATKDATGGALTNADATDCTTANNAVSQDIKAKTCGKTDAKGVRVDLTCNNPTAACKATYSVTFACADAVVDDTSADVTVTCNTPACTKAGISIPDGKKAIYAAPACDPVTDKGYLKQIAITGGTGDKYTFETKSAGTALTDTCVLATSAKDVAVGTTEAPLTCGKGLDTAITVEVTCARGDKTACAPTANTVTFACAAAASTDGDVAVACGDKLECTKESLSIPKGKKAVYTAPTCATEGQKAYLEKIAVTGATGDKLTFTTKSAGTALTDTTCLDATADATLSGGDPTALTCGKGLDTAITVEVACTRDDDAACAPTANTVTFACAAAAATPAPSTGSMLTKANVIVGMISGMVGTIVYFNRG